MKFVDVIPRRLALAAVYRYSVPYLVLDDKHTDFFKLRTEFLNIKADKAIMNVNVCPVVKNVQAAVYIEFQCRRDTLRFLFRLLLDFVVEVAQNRHIFRLRVGKVVAVHADNSAVNQGLFDSFQPVFTSHNQLTKGKDKIAL